MPRFITVTTSHDPRSVIINIDHIVKIMPEQLETGGRTLRWTEITFSGVETALNVTETPEEIMKLIAAAR